MLRVRAVKFRKKMRKNVILTKIGFGREKIKSQKVTFSGQIIVKIVIFGL